MTTDTTVSIALICSIVSVIGVIYAIYSGAKSNRQKDFGKEMDIEKRLTKLEIKLEAKLDYLTLSVSEMADAERRRGEELKVLAEHIAHHDEQLRTLFNRVEKLEDKTA